MNALFCRACKKPIDASAVFCPACGFDQRPPALQPTQTMPAATPVVVPPQQQPLYPNPMYGGAQPDIILREYARQYRTCSWLQFFGLVLLVWAVGGTVSSYVWSLIGLIMLACSFIPKFGFRRKIAEMGQDPDEWERPLRNHGRILFYIAFVLAVGEILLFTDMPQIRQQDSTSPAPNTTSSDRGTAPP